MLGLKLRRWSSWCSLFSPFSLPFSFVHFFFFSFLSRMKRCMFLSWWERMIWHEFLLYPIYLFAFSLYRSIQKYFFYYQWISSLKWKSIALICCVAELPACIFALGLPLLLLLFFRLLFAYRPCWGEKKEMNDKDWLFLLLSLPLFLSVYRWESGYLSKRFFFNSCQKRGVFDVLVTTLNAACVFRCLGELG